ncbi:MAG: ANTAR domain-containing protein, partial [Acetobacteraceae bacterium]|nr:ANTAR domain-containing protein [Acetobacteraceae bacterium]
QRRLHSVERKLSERQIVERAKAILMRERRLAEPAAYGWLRRQAMSRGQRIVAIAGEIIRRHEGETR